jgi:hypothetical protein
MAAQAAVEQLLVRKFEYFMHQLHDPAHNRLIVAAHHRLWCQILESNDRVVLLAPRDHGKTTVALAYLLWRLWCHGRDPSSGRLLTVPAGKFGAVVFSATRAQAEVFVATFRELLDANTWLFEPAGVRRKVGANRSLARSATRLQLANGGELRSRVYGTSTRGLHPDLLLLDDVLNDENSRSEASRNATWDYFVGTLLPMHARRVVILGTAFHQDDLLHRLRTRQPHVAAGSTGAASSSVRFVWHRFAALDATSDHALWPGRHAVNELVELREFNPTIFSREYQNRPRDDAASMFPYELTQRALDDTLTFLPTYRTPAGEVVVLGADLAISEAAGADFTAVVVVAFELATGRRRILYASRRKGLGLTAQLDLFADLCVRYNVDLGIVEQNGFAAWLLEALRDRPDTQGRFLGENTGQEKTDFRVGVPGLKMAFLEGRWVMPTGDAESLQFARIWQAELSAFGWKDGRLEGLGEHDDTVIATWYVERAIRYVERVLEHGRMDEPVFIKDVIPDWEPVRIGPDY